MSKYVIIACLCAAGSVYAPWLAAVALGFVGLEALSPKMHRERAELKKLRADLLKHKASVEKEIHEELGRLKTQVAMLTGGRRQ